MTDTQEQEHPGKAALKDVIAERIRQKSTEGWSEEHDDSHAENELAFAGAIYALNAAMNGGRQTIEAHHVINKLWPWNKSWWKPSTRRRDLVKAAALIIAEIERVDRAPYRRAPMNDAPDYIWATFDIDVSAQTVDVFAQPVPDGFVDKPVKYVRADVAAAEALRATAWRYDMDDPYINQNSIDIVVEVCAVVPGQEPIIRTEIADGALWKERRAGNYGVYAWRPLPAPAPLPQEGE